MSNDFSKRKGTCPNFHNCNLADAKKVIEVDITEDFVCPNPECKSDLVPVIEKKIPWKIIISAIVSLLLIGGGAAYFLLKPEKPVTVTLNKTSLELKVEESATLKATVDPKGADKNSLEWSSSDEAVATVSPKGKVSAVGEGNATITVSVKDDKTSAEAKCDIVVTKKEVAPPDDSTPDTTTTTPPETKSLSYGKFTGTIKNGRPTGEGRLTYNQRHLIDKHDDKARYAEKGDYIIGEWTSKGHLIQGRWYDSGNNVKESIILGMTDDVD